MADVEATKEPEASTSTSSNNPYDYGDGPAPRTGLVERRRSTFRQSILHGAEHVIENIEDAYERTPVPDTAFKGWLSFLSLFASRHTAGTEFAIGPLFVARGASAIDVIVGLFIGNILATLSWRYICTPIAVQQRFTAYYAMERMAGKHLMFVYDILQGLLLALLAGAMFTVSATAIGVLFNVPMPGLTDWLPSSWQFSLVAILCGLVTTVVAAFGVTFVTRFGVVVTPVLFAGVVYLFVRSLQILGLGVDGTTFWDILTQQVYLGVNLTSKAHFGMGHCIVVAWFCDLQLYIVQNDLSLLRFAKGVKLGWSSAAGMFVGHYFAWITAGFMYACQLQADPNATSVAPGPIAMLVGGAFGIVVVVIAGWSTANPILYSSGLAMQHAWPKTKAWASTLVVGSIANIASLFPALTNGVLELLAFLGLPLCPMGVMLFADFWVLPKMRIPNERAFYSENMKTYTNWPAVIT